MSLTLTSETLAGVRALFAKVLEVFTGGFAWTAAALTRHTDGVTLPAGTLLVVSEVTRQAKPVKRARLAATLAAGAATAVVQKGHLFQVGDFIIGLAGTAPGTIASVTAIDADTDRIVIAALGATGIGAGATGAALVEVGTSAATGAVTTFVGTANAIAFYPSTIEAGASVAALRRGTVYANRIQPVVATDNLPVTIQLSTSA